MQQKRHFKIKKNKVLSLDSCGSTMFIAYIEAPQFWLFSIFFVLLAYNSSNQVKNSNERDFVFVDEPKRIFIFNIKSMNKTADMTKFRSIYLHPFRFKKKTKSRLMIFSTINDHLWLFFGRF